jgi:hypothetical protein
MAAVEQMAGEVEGTSLPVRGPISELIGGLLIGPPCDGLDEDLGATVASFIEGVADPLADDDLQLALYICFELHYRSFPGVDDAWEWAPALIDVRRRLEQAFMERLTAEVGPYSVDPEAVGDLLFTIEADDEAPSLSRHLEVNAGLEQFREFVIHRSLYQLKEADPHSWAIPRLTGETKIALLEVQNDEYGSGRPERIHSALFAKTMRGLGLEDRENAYLDRAPGITLATVNLISAFGLRRRRRGALVGHLAMFEMTSARPNRRYGNALRRLGLDDQVTDFYDEHVEADAVHENIAAYDLAGGLARQEPDLAEDIIFGARALLFLEGRFASYLLDAWRAEESSLLPPP